MENVANDLSLALIRRQNFNNPVADYAFLNGRRLLRPLVRMEIKPICYLSVTVSWNPFTTENSNIWNQRSRTKSATQFWKGLGIVFYPEASG